MEKVHCILKICFNHDETLSFNSDYLVDQLLKKQYLFLNKCSSKEIRYL